MKQRIMLPVAVHSAAVMAFVPPVPLHIINRKNVEFASPYTPIDWPAVMFKLLAFPTVADE